MNRSVVYACTTLAIVMLLLITIMSKQVGHEVPRPLTEKCKGELCRRFTSLYQGKTVVNVEMIIIIYYVFWGQFLHTTTLESCFSDVRDSIEIEMTPRALVRHGVESLGSWKSTQRVRRTEQASCSNQT